LEKKDEWGDRTVNDKTKGEVIFNGLLVFRGGGEEKTMRAAADRCFREKVKLEWVLKNGAETWMNAKRGGKQERKDGRQKQGRKTRKTGGKKGEIGKKRGRTRKKNQRTENLHLGMASNNKKKGDGKEKERKVIGKMENWKGGARGQKKKGGERTAIRVHYTGRGLPGNEKKKGEQKKASVCWQREFPLD